MICTIRWMMGCSLADRQVSYHGGSELKCVACPSGVAMSERENKQRTRRFT